MNTTTQTTTASYAHTTAVTPAALLPEAAAVLEELREAAAELWTNADRVIAFADGGLEADRVIAHCIDQEIRGDAAEAECGEDVRARVGAEIHHLATTYADLVGDDENCTIHPYAVMVRL